MKREPERKKEKNLREKIKRKIKDKSQPFRFPISPSQHFKPVVIGILSVAHLPVKGQRNLFEEPRQNWKKMNVLKIFRRRSQSAPMKPSKDVTAPPTPLKNLLLLIDCDKEEVDNVLGKFKGSFFFLLVFSFFFFFLQIFHLQRTLVRKISSRPLATVLYFMWGFKTGTRTPSSKRWNSSSSCQLSFLRSGGLTVALCLDDWWAL